MVIPNLSITVYNYFSAFSFFTDTCVRGSSNPPRDAQNIKEHDRLFPLQKFCKTLCSDYMLIPQLQADRNLIKPLLPYVGVVRTFINTHEQTCAVNRIFYFAKCKNDSLKMEQIKEINKQPLNFNSQFFVAKTDNRLKLYMEIM